VAPAQVPPTTIPSAADGTAAERVRCMAIHNAAAGVQHELAARLVADGTPLVESLEALNADLQTRLGQAKALPSAATASLAGGNTAAVAGGAASAEEARVKALPEGDDKWKAEFAASPELQAEFGGDFSLYRGCKRNEQILATRQDD